MSYFESSLHTCSNLPTCAPLKIFHVASLMHLFGFTDFSVASRRMYPFDTLVAANVGTGVPSRLLFTGALVTLDTGASAAPYAIAILGDLFTCSFMISCQYILHRSAIGNHSYFGRVMTTAAGSCYNCGQWFSNRPLLRIPEAPVLAHHALLLSALYADYGAE